MNHVPILQVEDDENDVLFLRFACKAVQLPNAVHVVRDGQAAIDYMAGTGEFADRDRFPMPCLVLLDLKMPRKTGMDVLRWIREQPQLKKLVVIIFSASGSPTDVDAAYEAGANAFLVKPAGTDKLAEIVRAIQIFWLTHNHFAGRGTGE